MQIDCRQLPRTAFQWRVVESKLLLMVMLIHSLYDSDSIFLFVDIYECVLNFFSFLRELFSDSGFRELDWMMIPDTVIDMRSQIIVLKEK